MNKELACRRGPAAEVCAAIARVRACACARRLCVCLEGTAGSQGATRSRVLRDTRSPQARLGGRAAARRARGSLPSIVSAEPCTPASVRLF